MAFHVLQTAREIIAIYTLSIAWLRHRVEPRELSDIED